MQIDKTQIIDMILSRGDDATAEQANRELPDQVDTDQHRGLLEKFGLDPQDIISKLAGGALGGGGQAGGAGGILGGLGGDR